MKSPRADEVIEVASAEEARTLLGPLDSNTRLMRELHDVHVLVRDGSIRLIGRPEDVDVVKEILESSLQASRRGRPVSTGDVARRLRQSAPGGGGGPFDDEPEDSGHGAVPGRERSVGGDPGAGGRGVTPGPGYQGSGSSAGGPSRATQGGGGAGVGGGRGRPGAAPRSGSGVRARTAGQQQYLEAIEDHDVVLGVGPAGTGKTYLAVAAAVQAVREGVARRIVLVRPAVEAGEKLGFLPGDFQAKVDPYLRPLYDALHDLLDPATRMRYLESELVEVCPLAYMRGRTLNDSFVILDEAQNTTVPQMMMFLTRLGEGSKMVVTGDPSQIDLPGNVRSGLQDAVQRLRDVPDVATVLLGQQDVVRHPVVEKIIDAYEDGADAAETRGRRGRRSDGDG